MCRVTANEGDIGIGHLSHFQDLEKRTPVILTTSKLLTTGVDAPTCKNIVIARVVNSMTEFKQIIGRGTRVREDYGKLSFTILDYTGSATARFADPDFDGYPAAITEEQIDENGETVPGTQIEVEPRTLSPTPTQPDLDDTPWQPRKFYVDGGEVQVVAEMVLELDASGKRSLVKFTDYTAEQVRTLYRSPAEIQQAWLNPTLRTQVIADLGQRGIDFVHLATVMKQPEADPFDLLCHVAFNVPLRTRKERAERVRLAETTFFGQYTAKARAILLTLLDKYAEHGAEQLAFPDVLKVSPISNYGNIIEIAGLFGGADKLKAAVEQLHTLLYAA